MKQLLVFILFLCSTSVFAQDVIVKKDGSTIVCRVVEVTATEISYKKWSDLNGSNYVMDKTLASAINYESGKKVNLAEAANLYSPGNQYDGTQVYNDRALLAMDIEPQIKKYKIWGWVSGVAGVGVGVLTYILSEDGSSKDRQLYIPVGGALSLGCFAASTYCFIHANQLKNKNNLNSYSLYQQGFHFENGSSLSAGVDMISDRNIGTKTLGLGIRYNF